MTPWCSFVRVMEGLSEWGESKRWVETTVCRSCTDKSRREMTFWKGVTYRTFWISKCGNIWGKVNNNHRLYCFLYFWMLEILSVKISESICSPVSVWHSRPSVSLGYISVGVEPTGLESKKMEGWLCSTPFYLRDLSILRFGYLHRVLDPILQGYRGTAVLLLAEIWAVSCQ